MRYEKYDTILIQKKNRDNVYECFLDTLYTCNVYRAPCLSRGKTPPKYLVLDKSRRNSRLLIYSPTSLFRILPSLKLTQLINYFIHLLIRANRYAARVAKCTSRLVWIFIQSAPKVFARCWKLISPIKFRASCL